MKLLGFRFEFRSDAALRSVCARPLGLALLLVAAKSLLQTPLTLACSDTHVHTHTHPPTHARMHACTRAEAQEDAPIAYGFFESGGLW